MPISQGLSAVVAVLVPLLFLALFIFIFANVARMIFGRQQRRMFDMANEAIEDQLEDMLESRRGRRRSTPPPPPGEPRRAPAATPAGPPGEKAPLDFQCSHCGAHQDGPMDISPSGDVKCGYCGKWFNVRS